MHNYNSHEEAKGMRTCLVCFLALYLSLQALVNPPTAVARKGPDRPQASRKDARVNQLGDGRRPAGHGLPLRIDVEEE